MAAIGIDLGTTNSLIAVFEEGAPRLIPNALGEVLTPSAVLHEGGEITVGRAARDRAVTEPGKVATAFKRAMGTDQRIALGGDSLGAIELSSLVLAALRRDAEADLGQTVTEAVISVPA